MRFVIFCPANYATGGPEALHQLSDALLRAGADTCIYYLNATAGVNPKHESYEIYRSLRATEVPDADDTIIIVPEIFASVFSQFRRAQPCVWWLSVDNYLPHDVNGSPNRVNFQDARIVHLSQSEYATRFLRARGARCIIGLTDYIHESLRTPSGNMRREDLVLYNPAKGMAFTKQLIDAFPSTEFIALKGMDKASLRELFQTAKSYIDFGHHPGKDRMPREAAALGCCVLTSRSGAAGNGIDTPIKDCYKFETEPSSIVPIGNMIDDIFANYKTRIHDFSRMRDVIANQEAEFLVEAQVFGLRMADRLGSEFPAHAQPRPQSLAV